MDEPESVAPRRGRYGGRWINEEPDAASFAAWFAENVRLHEGMRHEDYVAGITLIQQTQTNKHALVGYTSEGAPIIGERSEVIFTPYPRVDVRIAYFWNYVALHPSWRGAIVPVSVEGAAAEGLPEGHFKLRVPVDGGEANFIGRTMRAEIMDLLTGKPVAVFPSESKIVPLLNRYKDVDEHAMAKASTGAIGRALGVAGMLVLPGSGVATAEDIFELQAGGGSAATPTHRDVIGAAMAQPSEEENRAELTTLVASLAASDQREALQDWWRQRRLNPDLATLSDGEVKIALQKAQALALEAQPVEYRVEPSGERG